LNRNRLASKQIALFHGCLLGAKLQHGIPEIALAAFNPYKSQKKKTFDVK
jgi:hypothetical protein